MYANFMKINHIVFSIYVCTYICVCVCVCVYEDRKSDYFPKKHFGTSFVS